MQGQHLGPCGSRAGRAVLRSCIGEREWLVQIERRKASLVVGLIFPVPLRISN